MKRHIYTAGAILALLSLCFFMISCDKDDDIVDNSFLVGTWNFVETYETTGAQIAKEYTYYEGEYYYKFDGKYFTSGGILINTAYHRYRYYYDQTEQTLTIENMPTYSVLRITETELELFYETKVEGNPVFYRHILEKKAVLDAKRLDEVK